ncbi:hypothetical protein IGI04_014729 [Brassica rapa subsp. trilocularis]|uniref:Uncharacterized protein n=1 Tax=Brassica rapa subsp. trilocularis TaxID=1813537 RepID=A0ABQ7MN60_BRACM|nr:hypothetical protein IGI04_014729 [Brassica rapa subsp. trilocularis]
MAATKMFLIKWYSSSTNLEVFQIWKTSGTTYLLVVWKSSGLLGSLLTKSSGLPGSRLDFQGVVWTSRNSFFIRWYSSSTNLKVFQIWKTSGTTYLLVVWKSSGSCLDFLKVVWTSCKVKSSGLLRSRLDFLEVVWSCLLKWNPSFRHRLVLHLTGLFQKFDFSGRLTFQSSNDLQLSRHRLVLQLKKKTSRFNYIQTTYNSVVHETTEIRRLNFQSSQVTDFKVNCKNNLCVDQTTSSSLAYIRLLQAHRITNESHPPRIVSFYDSMNHKIFRIKNLEWKKKKDKSILGALRASNWLFMVVVVLMTMSIL